MHMVSKATVRSVIFEVDDWAVRLMECDPPRLNTGTITSMGGHQFVVSVSDARAPLC